MMNRTFRGRYRPVKLQRGVALLEAMIATVILALGLLGAIGMQAKAFSVLADASMRAEATMASEKLLSMMTVDQAAITEYNYSGTGAASTRMATWLADTKVQIPGAEVKVVVTPVNATRTQVDLSIGWTRKQGALPSYHKVTAYVAGAL